MGKKKNQQPETRGELAAQQRKERISDLKYAIERCKRTGASEVEITIRKEALIEAVNKQIKYYKEEGKDVKTLETLKQKTENALNGVSETTRSEASKVDDKDWSEQNDERKDNFYTEGAQKAANLTRGGNNKVNGYSIF